MAGFIRWIGAAMAAIFVTGVLGVAAQSHFTLESLGPSIGPVSLVDRAAMIGADLVGFGPVYFLLVGGASLIAYLLASLLARFAPALRVIASVLAGIAGVLGVVMGLEAAMGLPILKGAASPLGLAAQAGAGLIGGLIFAVLSAPRRPTGAA